SCSRRRGVPCRRGGAPTPGSVLGGRRARHRPVLPSPFTTSSRHPPVLPPRWPSCSLTSRRDRRRRLQSRGCSRPRSRGGWDPFLRRWRARLVRLAAVFVAAALILTASAKKSGDVTELQIGVKVSPPPHRRRRIPGRPSDLLTPATSCPPSACLPNQRRARERERERERGRRKGEEGRAGEALADLAS
ncbi:Os11g0585100, partial [Oryza sativa Japonica Group]